MVKHENAVIVRMIQLGSVKKYEHILRAEYFSGFNVDIYNALRIYEAQYGKCMDEPTFRYQFPDFQWVPSDVQVEWYADELSQDFVKAKVEKLIADTQESIADNPKQITKDLQTKLYELAPYTGDALAGRIGLLEHGRERLSRMQRRNTSDESKLAGITTGFKFIDEVTNGTQEGEIEFYVARPGNGKSLTLLYSCFAAWTGQGKKISFVSPEMTAFEMGMRLDSMIMHISQMRMSSGRMKESEIEAYSDALETALEQMHHDISFRDTTELGRRFTTGDIRRIIEEDQPDILALDGILLIEPVAKYKDTRGRITNIMEELKAIVTQTKVPMRLAHQVNRESESRINRSTKKPKPDQKKNPLEGIPHLHELAESGSTEQYANRVICMRLDAGRMWYAIRKNRNGPEGRYVSVRFDIDSGLVADEKIEDVENPTDTSLPIQATLADADSTDPEVWF